MLTLGDVLSISRRSAAILDAAPIPPDLRNRLAAAADAEGVQEREFVLMAVADFAGEAAPEEWSTLISKAQQAADPACACLQAMIERRLQVNDPVRLEDSMRSSG